MHVTSHDCSQVQRWVRKIRNKYLDIIYCLQPITKDEMALSVRIDVECSVIE